MVILYFKIQGQIVDLTVCSGSLNAKTIDCTPQKITLVEAYDYSSATGVCSYE